MPYSTTIIRLLDRVDPSIKEVLIAILEEIERQRKQWEESVTKTEFKELNEIVADLAKKVNELAEAQKKTEKEIRKLVKRMDVFEERLEGISNSGGYSLENTAYKSLPEILSQRYGIKVTDRLLRRYFPIGNKNIQLNIDGHGKKNGEA